MWCDPNYHNQGFITYCAKVRSALAEYKKSGKDFDEISEHFCVDGSYSHSSIGHKKFKSGIDAQIFIMRREGYLPESVVCPENIFKN